MAEEPDIKTSELIDEHDVEASLAWITAIQLRPTKVVTTVISSISYNPEWAPI
jgi:hypothetical protein